MDSELEASENTAEATEGEIEQDSTEGIQEKEKPKRHWFMMVAAIFFMSVGVALSIKAGLGTSPISSVPYVLFQITGLSVGIMSFAMHVVFVIVQILLLRKNFEKFQLFQLLVAVLFSFFVDGIGTLLDYITIDTYLMQWVFCIAGIVILALGVFLEVRSNTVPLAGEGMVLAIATVSGKKFGNLKTAFDVFLVVVACIISLIFLHTITGVREGTLAAAICVGQLVKVYNKIYAKISSKKS